jgi:hypothetical protein
MCQKNYVATFTQLCSFHTTTGTGLVPHGIGRGDGEVKLDAATLVAIGFKALERFHPDVTNKS